MNTFLEPVFGEFYTNIISVLISATQWTIYLSLTAFIGGGLIGLFFTILKISPVRWLRHIATAYIWMFQAIPLLMLLFLIGLGLPAFFKINVPPWMTATVSLTLFTSAYMAEVWRGALESVPVGQWEGGSAVGLKFGDILWFIISPQAIRIAIPPTVGFMVQVIKGTSMAYIIDYNDLMRWGKKIANAQLAGAEPYIVYPMVALIYFCLCYPLSTWSKRLEKSMSGRSS